MDAALRTFVVFRKPGPGWVEGRDTREQPGWDEHARFMDDLHESGRVVLAGPYQDRSRVLLIVRVESTAEAEHLFDADPWTKTGVLRQDGVHEWEGFLLPPSRPGS